MFVSLILVGPYWLLQYQARCATCGGFCAHAVDVRTTLALN